PSLFITTSFLQTHLGVDGITLSDGTTVENGILLPETESQEGLQLGLNGILAANFGSQLNWLDLFDPDKGRSGVGRFALMDAGLFNGDGLLPAIPMAWTRIEAGWETAVIVSRAQQEEFTIHQVLSDQPEPRVYRVPINDSEYFLLENRFPGRMSLDSLQFVISEGRNELASMREVLETHFPNQATFSDSTGVLLDIDNPDRGLPGGGILIWHIDENVIERNRATNRINANPDHRGVDLEEADGSQDIGAEFDIISGGAGSELGTALDLWYEGNNAPLFIENPENEFSIRSIPNSLSYTNRANSHVRIFDFSARDSVMTFKLDLNIFQTNFPRQIDKIIYGKVTSLKSADLDDNSADELIFTTDRNKILIMAQTGQAGWGEDSLEILQLPPGNSLLPPVATFPLDNNNDNGMVVLSEEGTAFGYYFNKATRTVDSLFQIQCPAAITTFPIVLTEDQITGAEQMTIFWGSANGNVYQLTFDGNVADTAVFANIAEPIQKVHFISSEEAIIISESGKVYRNEMEVTDLPENTPVSQPMGFEGISTSQDGRFFEFKQAQFEHPEDEVHRFDSNPITIKLPGVLGNEIQNFYLVAGNNRLLAFNYNFTLKTNFPVKLYRPEQTTNLFLSPLVGYFPTAAGSDEIGFVVTDPGGMISAYNQQGKLLPDFPLAIGDSVLVSSALLSIDDDEDLELACVTKNGLVYVWDFPSGATGNKAPLWSQLHANPQNSNFPLISLTEPSATNRPLLPENRVYNWPNPNMDDYTFIRYRLNESADVNIKIFDLAGDLVKELEGTGHPNTDNEVRWDLKDVQSGIYLGRIEAQTDSRKEVQIIKIAVVK
nr:T9SS type A sorting domain-containing protein [candidate division Zixibacteria bacterium]NIV03484.1 T9SS type A sorting domain-containing protein [Calditrichia bacterium]NIV71706.1 T9SS type A sorting domain-containing protein [Calditrichia bacterium]